MIEIKFRAKTFGNVWVYGNLTRQIKDDGVESCFIRPIKIDDNPVPVSHINKSTIGQFTALYDKNGKEIYEGDIVECKVKGTGEIRRALVGIGECGDSDKELCYGVWVLWDKAKGVFYKEYSSYVEVIGNIYDNPELIKE